ncbi:MAG: MoaD/ThiS family protein [Ectothiorhodospiraceae bacterium]|nr:MoaD/ThiS family protein [Ectothiorhodospiraceae bacterium]
MSIRVKFFASLRETIGKAEHNLDAQNINTARDVWQTATDNHEQLPNMLVAINMEYAKLNDNVKDGDEVAFFPPVTGG